MKYIQFPFSLILIITTLLFFTTNSYLQEISSSIPDYFIKHSKNLYIEKLNLEILPSLPNKNQIDYLKILQKYNLSSPHSICNLKKYVEDRIPSNIRYLLKNTDAKLEIHYGPVMYALKDFRSRGFKKAIISYERKNLICEYAGVAYDERRYVCFLGNVYGKDRFWHDILLTYFYFKLNNLPFDRLIVKGNLKIDSQLIKAMFLRALKKVKGEKFFGAVIGYQSTLRWSLIKRKLLKKRYQLKTLPDSKFIWENENLFPDSFFNKKNKNLAGKLHPNYHLPYVVYKIKTPEGIKKIISFRNIWGEATKKLVELLYKFLNIKKFILFGNAGGINNCKIGTICIPSVFYEFGSNLHFKFKNNLPRLKDSNILYNTRHIRVFSPLLETQAMINKLKEEKINSIDLETTSFFKKIISFQNKSIEAAAILVITDLPGSAETIESKEKHARLLYKIYDRACDLIVDYLKIQDAW